MDSLTIASSYINVGCGYQADEKHQVKRVFVRAEYPLQSPSFKLGRTLFVKLTEVSSIFSLDNQILLLHRSAYKSALFLFPEIVLFLSLVLYNTTRLSLLDMQLVETLCFSYMNMPKMVHWVTIYTGPA